MQPGKLGSPGSISAVAFNFIVQEPSGIMECVKESRVLEADRGSGESHARHDTD